MDRIRPTVLLIGEVDHGEFRESRCWLQEHTDLTVAHSVEHAMGCETPAGQPWHTIVFALARPGQIAPRDVRRISHQYPFTHYVALLGSLCEGTSSVGSPGPGVVRVYWHQFVYRCQTQLRGDKQSTSWQLPRTASEAERLETVLNSLPSRREGLVAVFTRSALLYDALASACRTVGYSTLWCAHDRRPGFQGGRAAIWDGTTQGQTDFGQLQRICSQQPQLPIIALLAFARHDQVTEARACGARSVLTSPFLLPDLWTALEQAAAAD
jgi:hypothetical protein